MSSRPLRRGGSDWVHRSAMRAAAPEFPDEVAPDLPSTGTVDDDDDPADERPGENEPPEREHDENTEAPEEFERDDEDEYDDDE